MKRYFTKIYLPIISVTAISALAFVSCAQDEGKLIPMELPAYNNNFDEHTWKNANTWAIASVVRWSDGDTLEVNMKVEDKGESINTKIRVQGIDTPEAGSTKNNKYVEAAEPEKTYAKGASDFAKSLIPNGSQVKIWLPGTRGSLTKDSYNRTVGSLFYGENYAKNFSVEMIRQGWSVPAMDKNQIDEDYTTEFVLAEQAAIGFNLAWKEKKGIHKDRNDKNFEYLKDIYKIRGTDVGHAIYFIATDHPAYNRTDNYWLNKKK